MLHQFEISCKVCGARGFCDSENNGAIKILFEKGTPSTMDRIIIYCSECGGKQELGIYWPLDTNAILTSQSSGLAKLVKNQQDMPSEFNRAVDKMLDDEIANR